MRKLRDYVRGLLGLGTSPDPQPSQDSALGPGEHRGGEASDAGPAIVDLVVRRNDEGVCELVPLSIPMSNKIPSISSRTPDEIRAWNELCGEGYLQDCDHQMGYSPPPTPNVAPSTLEYVNGLHDDVRREFGLDRVPLADNEYRRRVFGRPATNLPAPEIDSVPLTPKRLIDLS